MKKLVKKESRKTETRKVSPKVALVLDKPKDQLRKAVKYLEGDIKNLHKMSTHKCQMRLVKYTYQQIKSALSN